MEAEKVKQMCSREEIKKCKEMKIGTEPALPQVFREGR